ncbi:hypothetical protein KFE25_003967 [Diacronema lutheri]|uniref:Uncharacterized protein n=1 Tax=Diacronema lutheri TaxID=2081491 RepID=A0A8J5XFQ3_DIALT|nr:hypothetical protein KFE25_003967 [Diacronema lutheri]
MDVSRALADESTTVVTVMSRLLNCLLGEPFCADEEHYLLVRYLDGRTTAVQGPTFLRLHSRVHASIDLVEHDRKVANEAQCVQVTYRDGRTERRVGPCVVTHDPFLHAHLELKPLPRFLADANQHMLVQSRSGETVVTRGPLEMILDPTVHEKIQVMPIQRYVADPQQYLVVQHRDGRKEHQRGPFELLRHPLAHESVELHEAVRLSANEALVVYKRLAAESAGGACDASWPLKEPVAGSAVEAAPCADHFPLVELPHAPQQRGALKVERRVVHGPAVFMPEANEWLHVFSWHGSMAKDGKGSKTGYAGDTKVPHALSFTVLRCMPDQMYFSVRDVRTLDDASLTVHLMLFYELRHVERMLDSTNDLIGDLCNAVSADVMTHASGLTYEQFVQRTCELSSLDSFPILSSRMKQVGTDLLKVVYRGYSASAQLQEMHDEAITRRTRIRLEADQAREEQEKRAMELRCRQERSAQEIELAEAETRHRLAVLAMQKEQERALADAEHVQRLRYEQERGQLALSALRAEHDEALRHAKEQADLELSVQRAHKEQDAAKLERMGALGVDLTQYLVALATAKPDAHLRIDTAGGQPAGGQLSGPPHLHVQLPHRDRLQI